MVAACNDLDPAGTATLRAARFYDYEAWPQAGRRPGAGTIAIFARIYQTTARRLVTDEVYASCGIRDLDLIDQTDHRHLDAHYRREVPAPAVPGPKGTKALPPLVPAPARCADLPRAVGAEEADVKRRELLFELALLLGGTPALRERLLRVYWSLSHMTGWCHYDLMDYASAARRYEEGLVAGRELGDPALLAHLRGLMADMAIFQAKPTMAMDHALRRRR